MEINWFNVLIDLYIIWFGFNYGKELDNEDDV